MLAEIIEMKSDLLSGLRVILDRTFDPAERAEIEATITEEQASLDRYKAQAA